jgi:hypothetical protein
LNYLGKSGRKRTIAVGEIRNSLRQKFKASQSIRQFAARVEISARNAAVEQIFVGFVGPERQKYVN